MNTAIAEIRSLLLDLIGPVRSVTQRRVDTVDDRGWATLLAVAEQHRLLPMLHWNLSRRLPDLNLPQGLRERCAAAHRELTLLALAQQRDLLLIHRRLTAAGIAHVAMKGAYLAYHAFPEPGLRPLRDLDILVPADRAVEAYDLLCASGAEPVDSLTRRPALVMAINHHLPGFRLAGSGTWVELHHQIFSNQFVDLRFAQGNSAAPPVDPALDPTFRGRCIVRDLAGAPISYMAPTDLLHHVIVHAVYAHEFNTGPLFLADIAWLLDSHEIDWPLFWQLVETRRQERGAELALRMMEIYWGPRRIDWSGAPCVGGDIPTAIVEAAAELSLRELNTSSKLSFLQDIRDRLSLGGKVRLVLRRLFPDRQTLAATYAPGVAHPLLTTLYIRHSRRLVFAYQAIAGSSTAGQDLNALAGVRDWLRGKASANVLLGKVANTPNPR